MRAPKSKGPIKPKGKKATAKGRDLAAAKGANIDGRIHKPTSNCESRKQLEILAQMSLKAEILKLGHQAKSAELRLIKRRIKELIREVSND